MYEANLKRQTLQKEMTDKTTEDMIKEIENLKKQIKETDLQNKTLNEQLKEMNDIHKTMKVQQHNRMISEGDKS